MYVSILFLLTEVSPGFHMCSEACGCQMAPQSTSGTYTSTPASSPSLIGQFQSFDQRSSPAVSFRSFEKVVKSPMQTGSMLSYPVASSQVLMASFQPNDYIRQSPMLAPSFHSQDLVVNSPVSIGRGSLCENVLSSPVMIGSLQSRDTPLPEVEVAGLFEEDI